MKKNLLPAILILAAVSGWGLFAYQYLSYDRPEQYFGKVYQRQAPDFTLLDQEGSKVSLNQFRGKIVLIAWGYTNCPDVCPVTLSKLDKVMEGLGENADGVQVLFITVDPERDTLERLKSYVPFFNKRFTGLTGTRAEIDKAASDYGVTIVKHEEVYGRGEHDTWDRYLMTHTNTVYLVDGEGTLRLTYPHYMLDVKGITSDLAKLLQRN